MYFDKPYYLEPQKGGERAYALMRDALAQSKRVGIAKVVMKTSEHLAAVKAVGNMMTLQTMRFAHEIVDASELNLPKAEISKKEMDLANTLIDSMTDTFEPEKYKDEYYEKVMEVVQNKIQGVAPQAPAVAAKGTGQSCRSDGNPEAEPQGNAKEERACQAVTRRNGDRGIGSRVQAKVPQGTMTEVRDNCRRVLDRIQRAAVNSHRDPQSVRLIAVTKTVAPDRIREAVESGINEIGENRLQEALPKQDALRDLSLRWHFIGHLQTNKAKKVVETFHCIQSVDRVELAVKLNQHATGHFPVFVEVELGNEETKSGIPQDKLPELDGTIEAVRSAGRSRIDGDSSILR